MPSSPQSQDRQATSRLRESWPPTQLRLQNTPQTKPQPQPQTNIPPDDEEDTHIDPLIYFLSPTPHLHPADSDPSFSFAADLDDDMDMDIDFLSAGIHDDMHPEPMVRSISPSSLAGLARPPPPLSAHSSPPRPPLRSNPLIVRPPTPPRTPPSRLASPDLFFSSSPSSVSDEEEFHFPRPTHRRHEADNEEDGEDYIRLGVGNAGGMLRAAPYTSSAKARRARAISTSGSGSSATRGRALARFGPPGFVAGSVGRDSGSGRMSPRSWRSPSPDVWDIREETEEEVKSEEEGRRREGKRVRFVLPGREAYA